MRAIYSNHFAFAGLGEDGTVAAWGNCPGGSGVPSGLSNVRAIYYDGFRCVEGRRQGSSMGVVHLGEAASRQI